MCRVEYFLIVINAYSKWPEVSHKMSKSPTLNGGIFAFYGFPRLVLSDNYNGSQFVFGELQYIPYTTLHTSYIINMAPYHPTANGLAKVW